MRIEHDGLALSCEPPASLPAGSEYELVVLLAPDAQEARVAAQWNRNGGDAERQRAQRLDDAGDEGARYVVRLPAFDAGDHVRLIVRASSGRRRVPADVDEDAASFEFEVLGTRHERTLLAR